jgi:hypothetical protein
MMCGIGATTKQTAKNHQRKVHKAPNLENILELNRGDYHQIWQYVVWRKTYKVIFGGKIGRIPDNPDDYEPNRG